MTVMTPYPAYRPSGAEWLGDVPEHWEVDQLGRVGIFSPNVQAEPRMTRVQLD